MKNSKTRVFLTLLAYILIKNMQKIQLLEYLNIQNIAKLELLTLFAGIIDLWNIPLMGIDCPVVECFACFFYIKARKVKKTPIFGLFYI